MSESNQRESRKRRSSAEDMAKTQKEISVSEFFAKNRHLLGFDNPRKALLTTVKEAVDNSLDACEEGGILPEIWVRIESVGKDKFKVAIQDNGPGIVKKQIPLIFGKLLSLENLQNPVIMKGVGAGVLKKKFHKVLDSDALSSLLPSSGDDWLRPYSLA